MNALLIGGLGIGLVVSSPAFGQEADDRIIREKRKARMEERRAERALAGTALRKQLWQEWPTTRSASKAEGAQATPAFFDDNPFLSFVEVGGPARPTFADIDGDGDLDLFVGDYYGNIVFFENSGAAPTAPAFADGSTDPFGISTGIIYSAPTFADIDADGDLDLFVGDFDGDITFIENIQIDGGTTGAGPTFAAGVLNPFAVFEDAYTDTTPDLVDIDGDADLDLFAGNGYYGDIIFFENDGDATTPDFTSSATNPFGITPIPQYNTVAFVDIDADGDMDLFSGMHYGDLFFMENSGNSTAPAFAAPIQSPFGLSEVFDYAAPTFADLDDDGDFDAVVGSIDGEILFQRNNDPSASSAKDSPTFTAFPLQPFGLASVDQRSAPTFVDLDDDGDEDALVGERDGDVEYFENTGDPSNPAFPASGTVNPFGLIDNTSTPIGSNVVPLFVDLDADGLTDVVFGEGADMFFFRNTGAANAPAFAPPVENPFGFAGSGSRNAPAFADLDNDGDLDYLAGTLNTGFLYQENTAADPSVPAFASVVSNPFGLPGSLNSAAPRFADIDGDNDFDLWVGTEEGDIHYYENTGNVSSAAFTLAGVNAFGTRPFGPWAVPAFADVDANGTLDLFVGMRSGRMAFFENQTVPDAAGISLSLTILLEGPYNSAGDSLGTGINGDLPLLQPYGVAPFTGTPLEYSGAESVVSMPALVVDWVLVQLRTGAPGAQTIAGTKAALLLSDGTIVDTDGSSPLSFGALGDDDYYVVVYHRNHLGVMTASTLALTSTTTNYNFSTGSGQAFGASPMKGLGGGNWGLWAGDSNVDGQITTGDFNLWLTATKAALTGYQITDMNLDGGVTASDFNIWLANTKAAASSKVPAIP